MQKHPLSFEGKLSLKDLNLFIKGLFLLVMTKFLLSMADCLNNFSYNNFFLFKKQQIVFATTNLNLNYILQNSFIIFLASIFIRI